MLFIPYNILQGWTNNEIFSKLRGEQRRYKGSSLTLPEVKRDDGLNNWEFTGKEYFDSTNCEKLPRIAKGTSSVNNAGAKFKRTNGDRTLRETNRSHASRSPRKEKNVKHLVNCERLVKQTTNDPIESSDIIDMMEEKLTPEGTILRLTGGIELVPLLARRRRVGARTLPSSDVTRPPEQSCQCVLNLFTITLKVNKVTKGVYLLSPGLLQLDISLGLRNAFLNFVNTALSPMRVALKRIIVFNHVISV